jgi:hypothetical protein
VHEERAGLQERRELQLFAARRRGVFELWVDDHDLVRRSRESDASGDGYVGVRDYYDVGVQVHVRAPTGKYTRLDDLVSGVG